MKRLKKFTAPILLAGILSCSQNNSESAPQNVEKKETLEQKVSKENSGQTTVQYKKMKDYFAIKKSYKIDIGQGEKLKFIEIASEPLNIDEKNTRRGYSREEQEEADRFTKLEPYAILETEITWKQFKIFLDETDYAQTRKLGMTYAQDFQDHKMNPKMPITGISRMNAEDFCNWLQQKAKDQYPQKNIVVNLPTPAQFLYAMAEKQPIDKFNEKRISPKEANIVCGENSQTQMKPVKSYPPNSLGLYDMIGNADEYVLCPQWDRAASMGGRYSDDISENKEKLYKELHSETTRVKKDSALSWSNVGFRPVLNIK
jgi:formylglycine-generating enzyme required for sulfatase activity